MYIIGLNIFHGDSSACILKDGVLISAVEEERFTRIKHWAGFPTNSIKQCLLDAKIDLSKVDHIAINQNSNSNFIRKFFFILKHRPKLKLLYDRFINRKKRSSLENLISRAFPNSKFKGSIHYVEHHLSHLSSAFHVSPFKKAIIVSVDGFGDFASSAWGIGNGIDIDLKERVYFPHSLGIFYQALTQFIGFKNYGDEYKVMGLAPYGRPKYMSEMHEILKLNLDGTFKLNLDYFIHHRENIKYQWDHGSPKIDNLFSKKLQDLLGPARKKNQPITQHHKDIAHCAQAMYENAFFNLLKNLHSKYLIDNISISGGCGMNSVANGKILENTKFKKIYVQSAAGDAGGAIGASMVTWHKVGGKKSLNRVKSHNHAYWGPSFDNEYVGNVLKKNNDKIIGENCNYKYFDDVTKLINITAKNITEGKVVGWFQGKMEWGPRALGNRSILADPRRIDMKNILNKKIKRRESFRPFAPSILREAVSDWFKQDDDVPFMMQVYQVVDKKRSKIPAVTHVDGSCRIQTVYSNTNPRFYNLIKRFKELTNVPMVLNTSFNENEPVVCKPEEALETFLRTKMDLLVIENWIIQRK